MTEKSVDKIQSMTVDELVSTVKQLGISRPSKDGVLSNEPWRAEVSDDPEKAEEMFTNRKSCTYDLCTGPEGRPSCCNGPAATPP